MFLLCACIIGMKIFLAQTYCLFLFVIMKYISVKNHLRVSRVVSDN